MVDHTAAASSLKLFQPSPAVEPGYGTPHPGAPVLVEDALAQPRPSAMTCP